MQRGSDPSPGFAKAFTSSPPPPTKMQRMDLVSNYQFLWKSDLWDKVRTSTSTLRSIWSQRIHLRSSTLEVSHDLVSNWGTPERLEGRRIPPSFAIREEVARPSVAQPFPRCIACRQGWEHWVRSAQRVLEGAARGLSVWGAFALASTETRRCSGAAGRLTVKVHEYLKGWGL